MYQYYVFPCVDISPEMAIYPCDVFVLLMFIRWCVCVCVCVCVYIITYI